ncbi:MAG: hypothetical protein AB7I27_15725 [Bacteriovoracaceae bacterium]
MIKQIIIPILYLLIGVSQAEDDCDILNPLPNETQNLINKINLKNCTTNKERNNIKSGKVKELCQSCVHDFIIGSELHKDKFKIKPQDPKQVLEDQFKKALTKNLLNVVSLRSLPKFNASFDQVNQSCDFKSFRASIQKNKKCIGDLDKIETSLAQELAKLLSPDIKNGINGIFDRGDLSKSCNITDLDLIQSKAQVLEDEINSSIANELSKLNLDDKNIDEELVKILNGGNKNLYNLFKFHPIFSHLIKSPSQLTSIFANTLKPFNKTNFINLLYKQNSQYVLDTISTNCQKIFSNYEKTACNDDFQAGNIQTSNLTKSNPLSSGISYFSSSDLNLDDKNILESNINLVSLCKMNSFKPNAFNFSAPLIEMNEGLEDNYKGYSLSSYAKNKYEQDFNADRKNLCSIDSKTCDPNDLMCKIKQTIDRSKDKSTYEGKLASSSNDEVNKLLRAFIGEPKDISPEAKEVLVSQGILPKDDGKFVQQTPIPSRSPGLSSDSAPAVVSRPPLSSQTSSAAAATESASSNAQTQSFSSASAANSPATGEANEQISGLNDKVVKKDAELSSIQNEILRRLKSGKPASNASFSKEDIQKVAREVYSENNLPAMTPSQEEATVAKVASVIPYTPSSATQTFDQKSQAPSGETAAKKQEKANTLAALSGMQGAQAVLAREAQEAESKKANASENNSNTVAVNVSPDKIKTNLSDLLSEKILKNDSEGQLLKSYMSAKKDFLLQLNNLSFRINFNKADNSFKIEHDSGDKNEAMRIKPQLESFFNRLNSRLAIR